MGKSENYVLFGNFYSFKVGFNIQMNDLMKVNEYQRSRSLFEQIIRSLRFQN